MPVLYFVCSTNHCIVNVKDYINEFREICVRKYFIQDRYVVFRKTDFLFPISLFFLVLTFDPINFRVINYVRSIKCLISNY